MFRVRPNTQYTLHMFLGFAPLFSGFCIFIFFYCTYFVCKMMPKPKNPKICAKKNVVHYRHRAVFILFSGSYYISTFVNAYFKCSLMIFSNFCLGQNYSLSLSLWASFWFMFSSELLGCFCL